MTTLWRTFTTYYCEACRADITRRLWAKGGTCPTCAHAVPAHEEASK